METASSFNQPRIKGENAQITTGGVERALPREEARLGPLSRCRARAVGAIRTLQTAHATYCRPKMRMPLTRRLLAFVTISCNTRASDSAPNLQLAPLFPPLQLIPPMRLQIRGHECLDAAAGAWVSAHWLNEPFPAKTSGKQRRLHQAFPAPPRRDAAASARDDEGQQAAVAAIDRALQARCRPTTRLAPVPHATTTTRPTGHTVTAACRAETEHRGDCARLLNRDKLCTCAADVHRHPGAEKSSGKIAHQPLDDRRNTSCYAREQRSWSGNVRATLGPRNRG